MNAPKPTASPGLTLAIATLAAIIGTLVVNTLSNFLAPDGQNVGEIANTILSGVLITPANYAFAIWGLIYLGLIAYGTYQLKPNQRQTPTIQRVNQLLIIACVAQMLWIFLFTLQYFSLSILAMLGILLPLMGAYLALGIGQQRANRQRRWLAHYPFSIYLAWISVATVVNVASALYAAGWSGWGLSGTAWTSVMIVVSAAIAALVIFTRSDIPFTLIFLWAYGAIAARHGDVPSIWITAAGAALVLLVLLGIRRWQQTPPSKQAEL
ncbi:MAG: tryptophan-rich sensory protein [Leptolyngbya sp. SIO1E4]|nr:tryptophan-rich sensory protein [Leptolyngbya sp. SIO1E4]